MKLMDMISTLRTPNERVEIRDKENYEILTCRTDSKALEPYLDCEIINWFPHPAPFAKCDFTVSIKDT